MTRADIDLLVKKYADAEGTESSVATWSETQYDDRSAAINYSLVREYKPTAVVEFGTRSGRCTNDILKALLENDLPFVFKPYELDEGWRAVAQEHITNRFEEYAVTIGGDVMLATDLPTEIDYLFVDNFHDEVITNWLFDTLLPRCKPGALVQIHDIPLRDDFVNGKGGGFIETDMIIKRYKDGTLPLKKLYWTYEEGGGAESSWWRYEP